MIDGCHKDYFNIKGNLFSFNGNNLNINKSIGDVFKTSINYDTDKNNPHIKHLVQIMH